MTRVEAMQHELREEAGLIVAALGMFHRTPPRTAAR